MNTIEISRYLEHHPNFIGVFPSDKHCLPKISTYPSALIINTDPHQLPGQHWIAIYFLNKNTVEYFNTSGRQPSIKSIIKFMYKNAKYVIYNTSQLQSDYSMTCGAFCIYYLTDRLNVYSQKYILLIIFLQMFI